MSLHELSNLVPCTKCKKEMVPLGKQGDTGKKKCDRCRYAERREYHKQYYSKKYKDQELVCLRCGRQYQEKRGLEICETCRMLAVDLFRSSQEQECIYCGKPSHTHKFCSHNCLVKTTKLARKREIQISEMIMD